MTSGTNGNGATSSGQTLFDITQLLESADGASRRVRRVLALLRRLVPYDQCAMLDAPPGYEPRVVTVPETPPGDSMAVKQMLLGLLGKLVDTNARPGAPAARPEGVYLAVPLVGLDQVIGLLFVRSSTPAYTEAHLRTLSVVSAKLGAYLMMLRAQAELADLARERDQARLMAETASRAKDEFLALVSSELKTPLNAILAWSEILRATDTTPTARTRALEEIDHSVQQQLQLIADIRDLSGQRAPTESAGPAQGATFSAELPHLLSTDPQPEGEHATRGLLSGIRVLFVDSDPGLRESFQSVLDEYGAQVTTADSPSAALAALERARPDVLLVGDLTRRIEMFELIRQVTARACPLPIASISAWALDDSERALAVGFRVHFTKPLGTDALVNLVADLAGRAKTAAHRLSALPDDTRARKNRRG